MIVADGEGLGPERIPSSLSLEHSPTPSDINAHHVRTDAGRKAMSKRSGQITSKSNKIASGNMRGSPNAISYVQPSDLLTSHSRSVEEVQQSVMDDKDGERVDTHMEQSEEFVVGQDLRSLRKTVEDTTTSSTFSTMGLLQSLPSSRTQDPPNTHHNPLTATESGAGARAFHTLHTSDLPLRSPSGSIPALPISPDHMPHTHQVFSTRERDETKRSRNLTIETNRTTPSLDIISPLSRPGTSRNLSSPANIRSPELSSATSYRPSKARPASRSDAVRTRNAQPSSTPVTSPMPVAIPLPPLSLPSYLQLELSSYRPSQIYIHRPPSSEFPYESSRVKIERLLNFIFLPPQLEGVLWFGTLACLDSWLYIFTILPLRLLKSLYILLLSRIKNCILEVQYVSAFIVRGLRRMWHRRRTRGDSMTGQDTAVEKPLEPAQSEESARSELRSTHYHRRNQSVPSMLLPDDKADILKGLLIICTSLVLLRLDASRMYHWVRGQAAIKLYVIYNVLEVCDRLLSAIGQDVLECLFSQEALERKANGHSKILRPFWLFVLALIYTIIHSTALFYQVVTLNVAVNSYSNALITLLMSNQFVEIKSTVFKKFEKDNLFQLTCADIVERFQLWHMLIIIAARNIVETGGFNFGITTLASQSKSTFAPLATNATTAGTQATPSSMVSSVLPGLYTMVSVLVSSLNAYIPTISNIMGPFVIVLGSEMLIDWLKHAYINKFNNTRPVIYGRYLDILAKDYYTNAFGDQNLMKRLGLPVIPLSCLMIRASVQTYHMFIAAWVPTQSPSATSLASIHELYSASKNSAPTSTAAAVAQKVDDLLYQIPSSIVNSELTSYFPAILIMLLIFLVLLACKLILGMSLLVFARSRYQKMMEREKNPGHFIDGGRRVGGWGVVEVDDDKRRWIYDDDPNGMRAVKEREVKENVKREKEKEKGGNVDGLDKVTRYEMVAKRIW